MMITLATLSQATAQEVFDQVSTHLLKQRRRSLLISGSVCAYRGHSGLKCAAGCLISDEEYTLGLERYTWDELAFKKEVPTQHLELIRGLQVIHDHYPAIWWERELGILAKEKGLKYENYAV